MNETENETGQSETPWPLLQQGQFGNQVYMHKGHFSAFGTDHPADVALGNARRWKMLSAEAKGQHPTNEQILEQSQSLLAGAGAGRTRQMRSAGLSHEV